MHGVGNVLNVGRSDSGHGDAAVQGEVDVKVGLHAGHLLLGESAVAEHADLRRNVAPIATRTLADQVVTQQLTHPDDPVSHPLALAPPADIRNACESGVEHQKDNNTNT